MRLTPFTVACLLQVLFIAAIANANDFTRESFIRRDANVDGQLSADEYLLGREGLDLKYARINFQEIDVDESQSLGLNEYVGFDPLAFLTDVEREVVRQTNEQRQAEGLLPVKPLRILSRYAREWTEEMVRQGDSSHGVEGTESYFANRLRKAGEEVDLTRYGGGAENCSRKSVDQNATAKQIAARAITGWMDSKLHRDNLMNPKQEFLGVGAVWSPKDQKYYFTQMYFTYHRRELPEGIQP